MSCYFIPCFVLKLFLCGMIFHDTVYFILCLPKYMQLQSLPPSLPAPLPPPLPPSLPFTTFSLLFLYLHSPYLDLLCIYTSQGLEDGKPITSISGPKAEPTNTQINSSSSNSTSSGHSTVVTPALTLIPTVPSAPKPSNTASGVGAGSRGGSPVSTPNKAVRLLPPSLSTPNTTPNTTTPTATQRKNAEFFNKIRETQRLEDEKKQQMEVGYYDIEIFD